MKTCSICQEEKPLESFVVCRRIKSGFRAYCKTCHSDKQKIRHALNPEKGRAQSAQWAKKNPDRMKVLRKRSYERNKAGICERKKAYFQTERGQARLRRWKDANRERLNAWHRDYYRKTWDKRREVLSNSKHRRRSIVADHRGVTAGEWATIKKLCRARCYYCKRKTPALAMDHVNPLSKGGKHEPSNIVPACKSCNSKKSAREPEDFAKSIGRLLI